MNIFCNRILLQYNFGKKYVNKNLVIIMRFTENNLDQNGFISSPNKFAVSPSK